ncbi:MAG: hypothetical protein WCK29_02770 [archaeon]
MVNKIVGYVVAILGIFILAVGVIPPLKTAIKIIPTAINDVTIMALGLLIAAVGIFFIYSGSGKKQSAEVPIYQGKEIVGYRRVGK